MSSANMGDVSESGESMGEGGERLPGTEDKADTEPSTIQEPIREPGASQEGTKESGTSQDGTRKPLTSQEGTREPGTSQEGAREPGTSQEGAREPGTNQEGSREPGTSQEGAREPGTSQEGARQPGSSQEGAREPGTSQEGAREPGTSQEGAREPGTSQDGATEAGNSQEGTRELDTSVSQESAGDPSAALLEDIEPRSLMEEDDKIAITENGSAQQHGEEPGHSSSDDLSEPHHDTEEYAVTPKEHVQETAEETDQEPALDLKENTEPLLEVQEGGQEEAEPCQDSELQENIEEEQIREELLQQYHVLVQERDKVQQQNAQLQHKLYEYLRKKKGEETRTETSKHASDQERRYLKYVTTLEEMRRKYKEEAALHQLQIEELRAQCQDIVSKVDKEWTSLQDLKKKISLCSIGNRGAGKHAATSFTQQIELLQSREERKEKDVSQVHLENIKLKNQINRYESTLRSKDELAEGLHLIDFEQLKIENQTYNEKIEERNEELLKLRKKITNTVQVLTHVKEKLQFVQAENQEQKEKLMKLEATVGNKRDILTKTKQARDSLRRDNLKLKQKCGLLGNKVLLRDFEDNVDATEELSQTLENLKRRHAELTLSSKGLMKKINEAKLVMDG